jgi:hypothetical protein
MDNPPRPERRGDGGGVAVAVLDGDVRQRVLRGRRFSEPASVGLVNLDLAPQ